MSEPTSLVGESTERTLGQLVAQATEDMSAILRAEVALAKAEITEDVRNGAMAGGLFGAAGYLGLLASILLTISAGYGLVAAGLAAWLAFLVVALVLVLLAGVLALVGKSRISRVGPPERALRSARQTIAAVRPSRAR
ncbi:MAG: phage holin family protein [Kineosporiaceae bacterium]|nr:phage holin family protein [Kineosporiaceae bacterium]